MAKVIRSVAEAIRIIEKEVEKAMSEANLEKTGNYQTEKESKSSNHPSVEPSGYCVECNAEVSSPRSYFCQICSESFYNGETSDLDAK